jgi:drug/metabolite transporter (DMT)-like permease
MECGFLSPLRHPGVAGDTGSVLLGCGFALASSLVYSASYVISEGVMSSPYPPDTKSVTVRMGLYATIVLACYLVSTVAPCWILWIKMVCS